MNFIRHHNYKLRSLDPWNYYYKYKLRPLVLAAMWMGLASLIAVVLAAMWMGLASPIAALAAKWTGLASPIAVLATKSKDFGLETKIFGRVVRRSKILGKTKMSTTTRYTITNHTISLYRARTHRNHPYNHSSARLG